jgi:hypothetical protein
VRLRFAEVDNQFFFNVGIDNVQWSTGLLYGTDGPATRNIDPTTGVGTIVGN